MTHVLPRSNPQCDDPPVYLPPTACLVADLHAKIGNFDPHCTLHIAGNPSNTHGCPPKGNPGLLPGHAFPGVCPHAKICICLQTCNDPPGIGSTAGALSFLCHPLFLPRPLYCRGCVCQPSLLAFLLPRRSATFPRSALRMWPSLFALRFPRADIPRDTVRPKGRPAPAPNTVSARSLSERAIPASTLGTSHLHFAFR